MERLDIRQHMVQSMDEIRALIGTPHEAVVKKSISMIDEQAKSYISLSPLIFIATSDGQGTCDVSPRGDEPGFVHIANTGQLVIPDRPGNRRADTLSNILNYPHAGLLFIIPGMEEILRVNGRAAVIKEHPILEELKFKGKPAVLGIVVDVEECFIHCPRALKQSGIWESDRWPAPESLPSANEIFLAHLRINGYKAE